MSSREIETLGALKWMYIKGTPVQILSSRSGYTSRITHRERKRESRDMIQTVHEDERLKLNVKCDVNKQAEQWAVINARGWLKRCCSKGRLWSRVSSPPWGRGRHRRNILLVIIAPYGLGKDKQKPKKEKQTRWHTFSFNSTADVPFLLPPSPPRPRCRRPHLNVKKHCSFHAKLFFI